MTCCEVLQELESLGTEKNRKTYQRHGVTRESYGVSFADLEKIRKRIKKDHALAPGAVGVGQPRCDTDCKTPEAAGYIRKRVERRKKK
jgi:hypothetical protein